MNDIPYRNALIIGGGPGISASLTRQLRAAGLPVVIAARDTAKLAPLVEQTGAIALPVDAADAAQVERLFAETEARIGAPEIVVYKRADACAGRSPNSTRRRSSRRWR
ncbi:SDR family NAD(P)-dependent oxidoreductase [Burkholderia plantarii]|uniref:SDR family NAD(P)-dependent oxidoreductase n=1 Tax=Burkholderia plantarii TaxID=41899 RepID=UPI00272D129E|nr:SDR family NAD(P)-dependent oxidoreductase [Burkholderia plantarii]